MVFLGFGFQLQLNAVGSRQVYQLQVSLHGNDPMVEPVVDGAVADVYSGQTQLSEKLRPASELRYNATDI